MRFWDLNNDVEIGYGEIIIDGNPLRIDTNDAKDMAWLLSKGYTPIIDDGAEDRPYHSVESSVDVDGDTATRVYTYTFKEQEFIELLKEYRDNLWRNSTVTLSNGAVLKVNDRTRADIADVYDGMMAAGISEYDGWSADNGFFTMSLQDFREAKVKGLQVVAKAFSAYKKVIETHEDTPYIDLQNAVDTMTTLFNQGDE